MAETAEHAVPPFCHWLDRVLTRGESVQDVPPELPASEKPAAEALLRTAFEVHALDVAGPPLPFDAPAAVGAAMLLARGCWCLVAQENPAALSLGVAPSPAVHLSADVAFRFLPALYRRARLREPDGPLTRQIERLLRQWPLAGVLADLDGEPAAPPYFAGHRGLQLLYAERLARTHRPGWVPPDGQAREIAERVHQRLGKPLPAPPTRDEVSPLAGEGGEGRGSTRGG